MSGCWLVCSFFVSSSCDLDDGDSPTSTAALLATPGTQLVNEAVSILQSGNYWLTDDYTDNWIINNVRISQTADGLVRYDIHIYVIVLFILF